MVVIGGVGLTTGQNGATESTLASMEQVYIFDTQSNQWSIQATQADSDGNFPSTRSAHSAIVSKLKMTKKFKLFFFL